MKKTFLVLLAPLAFSTLAQAQAPQAQRIEGATRQLQSTRQRQALAQKLDTSYSSGQTAPELYLGESADVGPQFLVIEKHRKTFFEAGVDTQLLYTSNVLLTEKAP